MGIDPDIWGPSTWTFLHLTVLAEKENDLSNRIVYYKQLYTLLQQLLPCEKCRKHLKENMRLLTDIETIRTKRELFDWTTRLHNAVNRINGKREFTLEESLALWSAIANGKNKDTPSSSPEPSSDSNIRNILVPTVILILLIITIIEAVLLRKKFASR